MLDEFERDNAATRDAILAQLVGTNPDPRARARLERLHAALGEHAARVACLLVDGGLERATRAVVATSHPRTRNPVEARLDVYLHQIHRDWGWGTQTEENEAALSAVRAAVAGGPALGTMLVFGAGACRLPLALHDREHAERTIALDVDPLAFVVARQVLAGASVELFEFPPGPRDGASIAVSRVLRAPQELLRRASRFHLVLGDAFDPPVARRAFDTVFTPWFIDQVPKDLVTFLPLLADVLRDGGTWLNHGPLLYHPAHTMLAHRYPLDEFIGHVENAGFSIEFLETERMTYLQSPAGTQGRTEMVVTLRATKQTRAVPPRVELSRPQPPWATDDRVPVARWPGLDGYMAPHPMFDAILALVDGQRSVAQIAGEMTRLHNLPKGAAREGVRTCLLEMYRAAQAGE